MSKNLIQRSVVEFPRALELKELEDLLVYVANHVPADINFRASYFGEITALNQNKKGVDYGSSKVGGTIRSRKNLVAFDSFVTYPSHSDFQKISKIGSVREQDSEEEHYKPEVIKLWGDVRQAVQKYFEEKIPKTPSTLETPAGVDEGIHNLRENIANGNLELLK